MPTFVEDPHRHAAALVEGHGVDLARQIAETNAQQWNRSRAEYWRRVHESMLAVEAASEERGSE